MITSSVPTIGTLKESRKPIRHSLIDGANHSQNRSSSALSKNNPDDNQLGPLSREARKASGSRAHGIKRRLDGDLDVDRDKKHLCATTAKRSVRFLRDILGELLLVLETRVFTK